MGLGQRRRLWQSRGINLGLASQNPRLRAQSPFPPSPFPVPLSTGHIGLQRQSQLQYGSQSASNGETKVILFPVGGMAFHH